MEEPKNEVIYRIWKMANKQNRNCMILVVGGTGLGKSLACIKMALAIQPDWSLNNLVFRAKDFLHLINSKNLKHGDVIVWDECGVEFDARTFYSVFNRMVSYVLQTFRHRNLVVFFNTPHESLVDVNLKRLFHYQFEACGIDYKKGISVFKCFEIEATHRTKTTQIYYKYPRGKGEDGGTYPITRIEISLPPQDIINAYEKKKIQFTEWLNKRAEEEVKEAERSKEATKPKDIVGIAELVYKKAEKYTRQRGSREFIDARMIANDFNVGLSTAQRIKLLVEQRLDNVS